MRWSPLVRRLDWLVARPIAHRGLHDAALGIVENTAGAFAAAMRRNYAIECDLQLSADGEAMVFHDYALERLTRSRGRVIERTAAALQELALRETTDRIQTLPALLAQVQGRVPLIVELKSHWDGSLALARRTAEIVRDYDGHLALMSFDPDLVAGLADLAPRVPRGIVADRESVMETRLGELAPRRPIASNTAFRMTGREYYIRERYEMLGVGSDGLPILGDQVTTDPNYQGSCPINLTPMSSGQFCNVTGDGSVADPGSLIAHNLKATKMDEIIFGYEHNFDDVPFFGRLTAGIDYTRRRLKTNAEDAAIDATILAW